MLNQKFWKKITKNYSDYQKGRTEIIGQSNLALNNAKKAIFALHRDNIEDSQTKLEQSKKILLNLEKKFGSNSKFRGEGAWKAAFEEFAEASFYFEYRKSGKVGEIEGIKLEFDEYLGGLADLTGELVRWTVLLVNKGDYSKMFEIEKTLKDIIQTLLDMNLTGHLRQKFDQAKKSQQRIEQMIYDLKIRKLI